MNKIKILNKEFEVGDMVEVVSNEFKYKSIGYLVERKKALTPQIHFGSFNDGKSDWFAYEPNIKSIKKLVYDKT